MNVDVSYGLFYFRTKYCTEVDVDLHYSEPIILFRDKADAVSFLAAVDDKEQDIFLQHKPGKNVLVNHPGVYTMKVFSLEYSLPLCVVLYEEYQNHPTYGKYIGWAHWKMG
jgi:hypothetical protein